LEQNQNNRYKDNKYKILERESYCSIHMVTRI